MFKHHSGLLLGAVLAFISLGCGGTTGTGDDAGVFDAGTACTFGTCGELGYCDAKTGTGTCTKKTCTLTNTEPDVCSYAEYCGGDASAAFCYDVGGACANPAISWDPQTSNGPVIYFVEKAPTDNSTTSPWCDPNQAELSVYVYLYRTVGTFAASGDTFPLQSLYYVRANGTKVDVADTSADGSATTFDKMFRPSSGYEVSQSTGFKELRLKLNFCGITGPDLVAGFYYTGGNEYCVSIAK